MLPIRQNRFFRVLVATVFLGVISVMYLWHHVYVLNLSFEISTLTKQLAVLNRENEYLQVALARELSLENIDIIAVERLGMVRPRDVRFVEMSGL